MRSRYRLGGGVTLFALAAAVSVLAFPDLPGRVAIHFGPTGQPDDYASRTVALALLPGTMLALLALFEVVPRVDPLRENIESFENVYDTLVLTTLAFLLFVHGLLVAWNLGWDVSVTVATSLAIAGLYVVLGYLMEHVGRNWAVGFRNPWTLSDETVWERTHDRGATALKLAGVAGLLGVVALPAYSIAIVVGTILIVAVYTTAYSYLAYRRRHPEGERTAP